MEQLAIVLEVISVLLGTTYFFVLVQWTQSMEQLVIVLEVSSVVMGTTYLLCVLMQWTLSMEQLVIILEVSSVVIVLCIEPLISYLPLVLYTDFFLNV